jgi:Uma2 family endonuclease
MPTAVTEVPYRAVPTDPPRKRWTRAECAAIAATGVWDQQRFELVEGELIVKVPKNRPHTNVLNVIYAWLLGVFGVQFVNPETGIDVSPEDNPTSEPEPDLIVLGRSSWEIREENPQPADIRLVIEISDSSIGFDLTRKAALYARAEIPEYWVVDIPARRIVVHREPRGGLYRSINVYREQESVSPLAAPAHAFRVGDAFAGVS